MSAKPKTITRGAFLLPVPCHGIQHHADVPLIGTSRCSKILQHSVDRLKSIWNLIVQMLLGGVIRHRVIKIPMDRTGTIGARLSSVNQESIFFLRTTHRDQTNCLLAQFDFKLIACFQVEQGGVCLADQKVAIALHRGDVGQLPTAFA